ncbi:alanine:cation symporter family protein [bacterium]|nr:alanine:cation symporter family protein [bacterium]MDB4443590.1 alanine:cation symporter family protein [Saprospiraceae bacterium]MDC3219477.1 alanine:cation symporter family protein [Saprospiraceae bacterium]
MELIDNFLADFASFVWGLPLLFLLIGGGFGLLIYSRFLPFRYLFHAIQVLRGKYDDPNDPGQISHFQALTTALSATIGMGNIAGVAVAISIGGPGAIFWMWISGIIGMSTKFFTSTLAIMYRGKEPDSAESINLNRNSEGILDENIEGKKVENVEGGPMYFIVEGLGENWKPLAIFFSLAGLLGALPVFNVNQLTQAIGDILLEPNGIEVTFNVNLIIGIILAIITSVVILGGLKRISQLSAKLVPSMVLLYFISIVCILLLNYEEVPKYFMMIFTDAFAAKNYSGDPLLGGMIGGLILLGIRRGAFSNEAGIGTAPMAHGAAKTNEPVREGLVAMLGPAIDTLIVCTLTALAILVTGVWQSSAANGVSLTATAFSNSFPVFGNYLLLLCVAVFSVSSLFSYSYYGSKCMGFIVGTKHKHFYNYFYIASIIVGATYPLSSMLNLIDGSFALMAIPTMTATILMAPRVMKEARKYFDKL